MQVLQSPNWRQVIDPSSLFALPSNRVYSASIVPSAPTLEGAGREEKGAGVGQGVMKSTEGWVGCLGRRLVHPSCTCAASWYVVLALLFRTGDECPWQ